MSDKGDLIFDYSVVDGDGMIDFVYAIGTQRKEEARDAVRSLNIRLRDTDAVVKPLDATWHVKAKQVTSGLLVMVYRRVGYSGGIVGCYDCEEGATFALFTTDGEVRRGSKADFEAELKEKS